MPTLPLLDPQTKENRSPHVVILGAGASLAAFPNGDKFGRKLPLMDNLIETVGLDVILKKWNVNLSSINFEDFFDKLVSEKNNIQPQRLIEDKVYEYFSEMIIPDNATLYDFLILSLRDKDLIASFNWDPMLVQAYRRNINLKKLPRICFLHGNVGIGACIKDKRCGYIEQNCLVCGQLFQKVRLLYPIKNKNYTSDPFIRNEWNVVRHYLQYAYFITIFGYSAPGIDVAARDIMLEVWNKNQTKSLAEIEIIDIKSEKELLETWNEFITRTRYGVLNSHYKSYLWRFTGRSCDAVAGATLQLEPSPENPYPDTKDLNELQVWVKPLINEETDVENNRVPFKIK